MTLNIITTRANQMQLIEMFPAAHITDRFSQYDVNFEVPPELVDDFTNECDKKNIPYSFV